MGGPAVQDATRQHFEQARLRRAITVLQALVGVLAVAVAGLVVGLTQVEGRLRDNASEIHSLRQSIQKGLGDFEPKVDKVIQKLDLASGKADKLDASLSDATGFDSRVDSAIGRANEEVPRSIERFFQDRGARVIAEAVAKPEVESAAHRQASSAIQAALDDAAVRKKFQDLANQVMTNAVDAALQPKKKTP